MREWYSPPQVARERSIRVGKVLAWIHSGELCAVNHAERCGGISRWRISAGALAAMFESLTADARLGLGGSELEDEVPEPLATPVSKLGDLWLLPGEHEGEGENALALAGLSRRGHRLLCGDSTKAEDVQRVLAGELAALVATDPPYLVEYTGKRVNGSGKDWSSSYREVDIADAGVFFRAVFTNVVAALAPHAAVYCWHAHKRQAELARVWEELGILDHQQIVWVKPSAVFGSVFWHFRHEPCMMGWIAGSKPPHDGQHEFNSVWEVDWEGKSRVVGNEHPTQKPLELFVRPMRKHTKVGDLCFEPFSGSGSQLIAAERMKRRCAAIELEPRFVDVAVRRWQRETGRKAVLERTTKTWDQRAQEAGVKLDDSVGTCAVTTARISVERVATQSGGDLTSVITKKGATPRGGGTRPGRSRAKPKGGK